LNPLKDFEETWHKCLPDWNDVQKQCSGWLALRLYLGVNGHKTLFPFRSVTHEPLEGFWRNLTQMFATLRWRAEVMFRIARFKVKVILRGQRSYDFVSLPLSIF
jgi:hypothetical protein